MDVRLPTEANAVEVFKTFLKLGLTSFGGPVAHIGYFRKELIERQRWVSENQFAQLLAICQFLPGPASSQLGFTLGLLRAGWLGAIAAFLAFTLPSALLLIGFAILLPSLSGAVGDTIIHGLKLVACAVVADAVVGMTKKLCPDITRRSIAVVAATAILLVASAWAQLAVIIVGAITGALLCREVTIKSNDYIQVSYSKRTGLVSLMLFLFLLFALAVLTSEGELYAIAQSFYNAGAMVFGGGHVVLPLLEDAVVTTGLISNESFLAGYGAAQAIPGPMFAFAAYLGAIIPTEYNILTAGVALLSIFLPGFLLVTAALPMWQAISNNRTATNAIAGVNAAVVGVLAAALYDPIIITGITSPTDLVIVIIGFSLLTLGKRSPLFVVSWCVIASLLLSFFKT
jgi:chromate transporter